MYLIVWSRARTKNLREAAAASVRKYSVLEDPPAWIMCGAWLLVRADLVSAALSVQEKLKGAK